MPEQDHELKRRLEDSFWSHLAERYPLTRWWWGPERDASAGLFPDWTRSAFEREAAEWRRLAKETVDQEDAEIRHWGQFARVTANRILAGSWTDAAEPVRQANLALTVVGLLDPAGEQYPRLGVVENLAAWLSQVQGVSAVGFWRRTRLAAESARLLRQLARWTPGGDAGQWQRTLDNAAAMVKAYGQRAAAADADQETIPWAMSANVQVETWRERRETLGTQNPVIMSKPVPSERLLGRSQSHAAPLQEVVVPGLSQWWVRPGPEGDILYHGDMYDPSVSLGAMLALWRHESPQGNLTWALSQPPLLEGGLTMMATLLHTLWPDWPPIKNRYLGQWLQRRQAMAVADAWLWLEAGDPREVLAWMGKFLSQDEGVAVIPWMKCHPGYYVMSDRVWEVLDSLPDPRDWSHWLFRSGPIVPDAVFSPP